MSNRDGGAASHGKPSKQIDTRRIAINAIFIAAALIMFLVESQFPPIMAIAPGAKMGLSNIFSLVALVILGTVDAYIIIIMRCLLAVMFGTPASTLLFALPAGLISLTLMALLYHLVFPRVTIIAISVAGAVMHNIVQIVVLCIQEETWQLVSYLPWLATMGVVAGIIVGITSFFLIKQLPVNTYFKPVKTATISPQTVANTNNTEENKKSQTQTESQAEPQTELQSNAETINHDNLTKTEENSEQN